MGGLCTPLPVVIRSRVSSHVWPYFMGCLRAVRPLSWHRQYTFSLQEENLRIFEPWRSL